MAFLSRSILALSMALLSCNAIAQKQCDVELRHGLIITDDVIRIVDKTCGMNSRTTRPIQLQD